MTREGQSMNSPRCNLRSTNGKSTAVGLTVAGSGPSGAEAVSPFASVGSAYGYSAWERGRLHCVSFAGLLRSLDPAYPLRKDGHRKSGKTPNPNF